MTVMRSRVRKSQRTFEERLEFLLDEQDDIGAGAASVSTVRRGSHGKKLKRFVGVRQRPSGRWVAEIKGTTQKIRRWLGTFDTAEDAAHAYDEAARSLRGANTRTNFAERPPVDHHIFRFPSSSLTHSATKTLHSRKEAAACSAADGKCRCSSPASFLRPRSDHLQEKKMQSFIRRMEQENFRPLSASTTLPTARVFQFPTSAVLPKFDTRTCTRFMRSGPGDLFAIVAESARGTTGCQLQRTACAENSTQAQTKAYVLWSQELQKITEDKRVESTEIFGSGKENADHASTEQPTGKGDARFVGTSASFIATEEMSRGKKIRFPHCRSVGSADNSSLTSTGCVITCDTSTGLMSDFATPSCVGAALDPASFSTEMTGHSNSGVDASSNRNAGSEDPLSVMFDSPSPVGTALQTLTRESMASYPLPAFEDDVYERMESQRLDGGISCLVSGLKGVRSDYIQGFLFL